MNNKTWPIGIYDSGLGGLTVVKEIIKLLPSEDIIYLGDTARVPYGTRSKEVIKRFSIQDVQFLLKMKVKCIVIACHTSSAVAKDFLKKKFNKIPVFDVVSPVLERLGKSKKTIGVIGTRATIGSGVYSKLNKVVQTACPLFVPFIEEGEVSGNLITLLADKYLKKMKNKKVKILILGCTHYPLIDEILKKELPGIRLVNPAVGLAKELKTYLTENRLLNINRRMGKKSYYVTDLNDRFIKTAEMFLGKKLNEKIRKVDIE